MGYNGTKESPLDNVEDRQTYAKNAVLIPVDFIQVDVSVEDWIPPANTIIIGAETLKDEGGNIKIDTPHSTGIIISISDARKYQRITKIYKLDSTITDIIAII